MRIHTLCLDTWTTQTLLLTIVRPVFGLDTSPTLTFSVWNVLVFVTAVHLILIKLCKIFTVFPMRYGRVIEVTAEIRDAFRRGGPVVYDAARRTFVAVLTELVTYPSE